MFLGSIKKKYTSQSCLQDSFITLGILSKKQNQTKNIYFTCLNFSLTHLQPGCVSPSFSELSTASIKWNTNTQQQQNTNIHSQTKQ